MYLSCSNIQNGLRFEYNCIKYCCFQGDNTPEPLFIKNNYYGEKLDWYEQLSKIHKLREGIKNKIIPKECVGCFALQEKDWDDNTKFKWIQVAHWTGCNCNCIYCYRLKEDFVPPKKKYKIMPIIKELDKMGLIDYSGELAYSGGEPTCLPEFDDITNFFIKKGEKAILVHTNAIKPIKSVLTGLKTDTLSVTVSVDCGDREKFKQIKQVDAYNKVVDTLKKYVKAQGNDKKMVRSKYILIPNVNDTIYDINKWLDESEKIGIHSVVFDFEAEWFSANKYNIPTHIHDLYYYICERTKNRGFDLQFYAVALEYRKLNNLNTDGFSLHIES